MKLSKKILAVVLCSIIASGGFGISSNSMIFAEEKAKNETEVKKDEETKKEEVIPSEITVKADTRTTIETQFPKSKELKVKVVTGKLGEGYLKVDLSRDMISKKDNKKDDDKKPLEIITNSNGKEYKVKLRDESGRYGVDFSTKKSMYRFIIPCSDMSNAEFKIVDPNSELSFKDKFVISVQTGEIENKIVPAESKAGLSLNNIVATSQYEDEKDYEGFIFGNIGGKEVDTFVFRPKANSSSITLHLGTIDNSGFNYNNYGDDNKFKVEYFNNEETYKKIKDGGDLYKSNGDKRYKDTEYTKKEVRVGRDNSVTLPWYPDNGIIRIKLNKPNLFLFRINITEQAEKVSTSKPSDNKNEVSNNDSVSTDNGLDSKVNRISGSDRYKTAIELSEKAFNSADTAVIASGDNFADALSGGPLAYIKNAPLLLVSKDGDISSLEKELDRLGVKKVYLLGGRNSISVKTEDKLRKLKDNDMEVLRLSGEDRFSTSLEVYREFTKAAGTSDDAILVNGNAFADALSAGPLAAHTKRAIVLTNGHNVPKEALRNPKRNTIIGGYSSMDRSIEGNRISGSNRYETSVNIAKSFDNPKNVMLASGEKYPDGLASISLYKKYEGPLLLTPANSLPKVTKNYIKDNKVEDVYIIGGTSSVSSKIADMFK